MIIKTPMKPSTAFIILAIIISAVAYHKSGSQGEQVFRFESKPEKPTPKNKDLPAILYSDDGTIFTWSIEKKKWQ